ncbi:MAG TPA: class I SAM-dependent methyltransferase [Sneathiellales bacterium]|nr:class I SAM-dependent methyltransferase [Sneathiellales bacterium]
MKLIFPNIDETRKAFDPFVYERWPEDAAAYQGRSKLQSRKWRKRKFRRSMLGWLPSSAILPRVLRGRRTQDYVHDSYSETWSEQDWPNTMGTPLPRELSLATWRGEGLHVRRGGLARSHMPAISAVLEQLMPKTVLEVGAGMGLNLLTLSARFPEVAWTGIELTKSGVKRAKSIQKEITLPQLIADYCPWEVADKLAYQQIEFLQGNATNLPFDDDSFDLVFTRQALEQMEAVRDLALAEISRVARAHVVMLEPFADFNQSPANRDFVSAKDYFSLTLDELSSFGIEVMATYDDFPQKLTLGQGLVVGKVA